MEKFKFKYTYNSCTLIQVLRLIPYCFPRRTLSGFLQDLLHVWTPILITQHFSDFWILQLQLLWKIQLFSPEGCTGLEGFKKVLHWRERNGGSDIMKEVSEGPQNQKVFFFFIQTIGNIQSIIHKKVISYIHAQSWIHSSSNPRCRLQEA